MTIELNGRKYRITGSRADVTDYGAIGDGIADDTNAIQKALDSGSRFIYFPSGDYVVSAGLTIKTDRTSIRGAGICATRIYRSADSFDIFTFAAADPTTTRVRFVSLSGMEISSERIATNTGGAALRLTRVQRASFHDLYINGGYGGILMEGGDGVNMSNLQLYSNQSFGGNFRAGSYLMKFTHYDDGAALHYPSEVMIDNINAKGSSANDYLDNAIVVECSDGIWFSTGHIGFARNASVLIAPTNNAAIVWGLNFDNIHFDGNDVQQYGVLYDLPLGYPNSQVQGHSYANCQATHMLADGYCFDGASATQIQNVTMSGGRVNLCAGWGIRIGDGTNYDIQGITFFSLTQGCVIVENADFVNVDCIYGSSPIGVQLETNCTRVHVDGVFSSITSQDVVVNSSNITNTVRGSTNVSVVVASASDITLPLPTDVFSVTGTTQIDTINASDALLYRRVTLLFTGNCAMADSAIKLAGAFTSTAGSSLSLIYNGSNWVETGRAIV